jgi:hypothetical protein
MSTKDRAETYAFAFRISFLTLVCTAAYLLGLNQEALFPTPKIESGCKVPKGSLLAMLDNCPGSYKMNKDEYYIIFEDGSTKTIYSESKDKARAMTYKTGK